MQNHCLILDASVENTALKYQTILLSLSGSGLTPTCQPLKPLTPVECKLHMREVAGVLSPLNLSQNVVLFLQNCNLPTRCGGLYEPNTPSVTRCPGLLQGPVCNTFSPSLVVSLLTCHDVRH